MNLLWTIQILIMLPQISFKQKQQQFSRVKTAYDEKEDLIHSLFQEKGYNYQGFHLFIRAFKEEKIVEVWIQEKEQEKFLLLSTYSFCTTSGALGPKRKEGDLQIPEGVYSINHFNLRVIFIYPWE